jgi:hypothetical protein
LGSFGIYHYNATSGYICTVASNRLEFGVDEPFFVNFSPDSFTVDNGVVAFYGTGLTEDTTGIFVTELIPCDDRSQNHLPQNHLPHRRRQSETQEGVNGQKSRGEEEEEEEKEEEEEEEQQRDGTRNATKGSTTTGRGSRYHRIVTLGDTPPGGEDTEGFMYLLVRAEALAGGVLGIYGSVQGTNSTGQKVAWDGIYAINVSGVIRGEVPVDAKGT